MNQKMLGANADAERRELLKQYILACVKTSVLSWSDITSAKVFDKLLRVISKDGAAVLTDFKTVAKDLGRAGASGLLRTAGVALAGIAEDVVAGRRPR